MAKYSHLRQRAEDAERRAAEAERLSHQGVLEEQARLHAAELQSLREAFWEERERSEMAASVCRTVAATLLELAARLDESE